MPTRQIDTLARSLDERHQDGAGSTNGNPEGHGTHKEERECLQTHDHRDLLAAEGCACHRLE